MRLAWMVAAVLVSGCAAGNDYGGGATDDFIDMDTPPGNCSATVGVDPCPAPDTSGSPEGGPCIDTQDCVSGTSCVAPYDSGVLGEFVCSAQCIPPMDESAWCLDSSACCDGSSVCSARGLCVPSASVDESGSGGESTTDTDSSTAGESDGSSSGGSSGSSGGSSTGAATGTTGMQ